MAKSDVTSIQSVFLSPAVARMRENPSAAQVALIAQIVAAAAPWLKLSVDALHELVVGPTLDRSWMVWSNGHCPACKQDVRMYEWHVAAMDLPWKFTCPRCEQRFPTNDFEAFYKSGLDAGGLFQADRADRDLLFNAAHPDATDPLRSFGVDDGTGFRSEAGHWRFVAAYLVYGQWKQRVVDGAVKLADAFAATGDAEYATRAAIILHRVAELYPSFDFKQQSVMYDKPAEDTGYVSVWHDSCAETRTLALAYDHAAPGIVDSNTMLCTHLGRTAAQIHARIRQGLLEDPLANPMKIYSNFPQRQSTEAVLRMVLDPVANRDAVLAELDSVIERSIACNGSTGEKGMQNYTAFATRGLSDLLAMFSEMDPTLVSRWLETHPGLPELWRFHVNTWCQRRFYPTCGDAGDFCVPTPAYAAISWSSATRRAAPHSQLIVDRLSFLYRLYCSTDDALYAQLIHAINGDSLETLPPLLAEYDEATVREGVQKAITRHGSVWNSESVDLDRWHLAIQRSGAGEHARDLWMDYDSGGMHGHNDALNLGLFACGLDLMSDFGYPPVGHGGGWAGAKAQWYKSTAAHNTVLVDRQEQNVNGWRVSPRPEIKLTFDSNVRCRTRLWIDQSPCHGMWCEAQAYEQCTRYERLSVMVDLSDTDFYVVDIVRVVGGAEHVKFQHTQNAVLNVNVPLSQAEEDFGPHAQMRAFRWSSQPLDRWSASFVIDDGNRVAPHSDTVTVDYHDLTRGAYAGACEGWVVQPAGDAWNFSGPAKELMIPRVMTRRSQTGDGPLTSCFVALIVPRRGSDPIRRITRAVTGDDMNVELEIELADGRIDRIVALDQDGDSGFAFKRGNRP